MAYRSSKQIRMDPTFENDSVCKETTTQSNDPREDKSSTKEREGEHAKQESESSEPSSPTEKTLSITKQVPLLGNTEYISMETAPIDSTSTQKDDQDDQLESTKAEMSEVREENERLKQLLGKTVKDYQTLQTQFFDILQQEDKKSPDKVPINQENEAENMVSLSLGISSTSDHEPKKSNASDNKEDIGDKSNDGLRLGLKCKFDQHESTTKEPSSEGNSQENKQEEPTEVWPPSKILRTMRSGDDETLQQSHLKKPRVCVRTRCDTPTMNDGCQWRKYGQKIAKGNPCPRAYYRCTVSPNCPVRKQVQRYSQDMSILITTYEGTHNHPLPASATAMASTTSAAASMLQSRSSSSTSEPTSLTNPTTLTAPLSISNSSNMHGSNFTFSQSSRSSISPHFYIPNSSISTLNSHPTITLDLTVPPNNNTSQYFNRFSNSSFPSSQRYPSTCLNFSSSSSLDSNNAYFTYGTPYYNNNNSRNQFNLSNLARHTSSVQEQVYQPFMHMQNSSSTHDHSFTDTIAAATKVIAANPSFQSALAAALTSVVGNGGQESGHSGVVGSSSLNLKLGEALHLTSTSGYTLKQNANVGCASRYSNNPQQQGGLSLFPSSLPHYKSKSAPGSSDENVDHS